jgi:alpha-N-arabinofuranosidase
MHWTTFSRVTIAASLLSSWALAQEGRTLLTIHGDKPTAKVSPTLYGLMTEEINYSYDGGLYAEMIQNRTFHSDWSGILHWYLVEKGSANAKIAIDRQTGPSDSLKTSLRLEVSSADAQSPAGVLNEGYWAWRFVPTPPTTARFTARQIPLHRCRSL